MPYTLLPKRKEKINQKILMFCWKSRNKRQKYGKKLNFLFSPKQFGSRDCRVFTLF